MHRQAKDGKVTTAPEKADQSPSEGDTDASKAAVTKADSE